MSELTSLPSAARRACVPVLTPVWAADADPLMIQPGRPLLCGSGDSCELQVLLAGVQKQHCELESRRGVLVITRVMASVWVNDIPASAGTAVQPGDRVAIGSATFRSELLDYEDCTPHAAFTPFGYRPASAGATASSDSGIPHSEQLQEWHDALQQRSNHLSEQAKLLESRFARLLQNQAEYDQRAHELEEAREALRLERDEIAAKHARAQEQLKHAQHYAEDAERRRREDHERSLELDRRSEELRLQSESLTAESTRVTQQAGELENRRATLESECESRESDWAQRDAAITQQEQELQEQQTRCEQTVAELEEHQQQLEQLAAELDERESATASAEQTLQQNLTHCEERETSLQTALEQQEAATIAQQQQQEQIEQRLADLDQREEALTQRCEEAESRSTSIEQRETEAAQEQESLEERRSACAAREAILQEREQELAALTEQLNAQSEDISQERESLQEQTLDLQQRESELAARQEQQESELTQRVQLIEEREQQLAQAEQSIDEQTTAAAAEQEESASLAQAELAELRTALATQQESLDHRHESLQQWEAELQARHEETAERVTAFKRARSATHNQNTETPASTDQSNELTALLQDSEARLLESVTSLEQAESRSKSLQAERDQLSEALQDLQMHVESLEQHISAGDHLPGDADQEQQICVLTNALDDRTREASDARTQLQEMEQRVAKAEARQSELEILEAKLREQLQVRMLESAASPSHDEEEQLLLQVNELRDEISAAAEAHVSEYQALEQRSSEQENLIVDLTDQLKAAEGTLSGLRDAESAAEQTQADLTAQLADRDERITELQQLLREAEEAASQSAEAHDLHESPLQRELNEREQLIRDLREQLVAGQKASTGDPAVITDEEIRLRSRELDDRTVVLDQRDDDLRDWDRQLRNTEEKMEAERRQLQDARQQLELARAELQVSIEHESPEPIQPSPVASVDTLQPQDESTDVPADSTTHLRSELASLFGMVSVPETPEPEPVDVSTEGGDSVLMSFEETQGVLLEAQAEEPLAEPEDYEDNDYVTRYMEQLLARNRSAAGESLPEELDAENDRPLLKAPPAKEPSPAPPVSFIEQYMQTGELESPTSGTSSAESTTHFEATDPAAPRAARQKIDLDALRQDMDSFRQVSVRSGQKALASHAMKKERSGLAGRQAVMFVTLGMTVFIAAENTLGVLQYPRLVWTLVAASLATVTELVRRTHAVKSRVREITEPVAVADPKDSDIASTLATPPP